jgi:hypothetical protein
MLRSALQRTTQPGPRAEADAEWHQWHSARVERDLERAKNKRRENAIQLPNGVREGWQSFYQADRAKIVADALDKIGERHAPLETGTELAGMSTALRHAALWYREAGEAYLPAVRARADAMSRNIAASNGFPRPEKGGQSPAAAAQARALLAEAHTARQTQRHVDSAHLGTAEHEVAIAYERVAQRLQREVARQPPRVDLPSVGEVLRNARDADQALRASREAADRPVRVPDVTPGVAKTGRAHGTSPQAPSFAPTGVLRDLVATTAKGVWVLPTNPMQGILSPDPVRRARAARDREAAAQHNHAFGERGAYHLMPTPASHGAAGKSDAELGKGFAAERGR